MFHAGQQIGAYILIERLGKGGFGEVWLAEKRSQFITKRVAIKLPLDEQVNFEAIKQEATLWEQASGHPNVLPIIDADVYDEQVVIVSEYAEGGSLADRLKKEGRFSNNRAVEMTLGILSGLEFLHKKAIIHRDIKPANVLLQNDIPRLADFGISRAIQATGMSSTIIGTGAYMSPESFKGIRTIQTDVWSVGVVLYELLTGRLPFPQDNDQERMYAILQEDFASLPADIPINLRRIVEKALTKTPKNRYQTALEMYDELKDFLAESFSSKNFSNPPSNEPLPETRAFSAGEQETMQALPFLSSSGKIKVAVPDNSPKPAPNRNYFIFIAAAVLLFAVIGSAYWLSNNSNPPVNRNTKSYSNLTVSANTAPSVTVANLATPQDEPLFSRINGKWTFSRWENDPDRAAVLNISSGSGSFVSDSIYNVVQDASTQADEQGFIISGSSPTLEGTNTTAPNFAADIIRIFNTNGKFEVSTIDFKENKVLKPVREITQAPSYTYSSSVGSLDGAWNFVFPGGSKYQMNLFNGSGKIVARKVYDIRETMKVIKNDFAEIILEGSDPTIVTSNSNAKIPKFLTNQIRFELRDGNIIVSTKKSNSSKWQRLNVRSHNSE